MSNRSGLDFLSRLYKDLHNSEVVMHKASLSDSKNVKVEKYLNRLEKITNKVYDNKRITRENDINLLKKYYYDKYIIKKENIPESYFELQKKIALEEGHGHLEYNNEIKELEIEHIISEQKHSLDKWLDYFVSKETDYYPTWFKYYAFQGMLGLGQYDKKTGKFTRRTDKTTKPFVEINREAVAFIYSYLVKYFDKREIEDIELKKLLESGSFSKLYAYSIKKLDSLYKDNTNSDEGIWKKYIKGSNPEILFNDIYGKGTGWCTAGGIETAKEHINGGDFYVYYTKDKDGNYTNPRIAIRMNNNHIAEIRGIAENQNLESNMEKIVEEKLEGFPDKDTYKKKVNDMKMMTYIYTKFQNKVELTKEDLRFLYEIDNEIIGFGYKKDPRIEEIINRRNKARQDLAKLFSCKEEAIALFSYEALSGNIRYCRCDLDLSDLTSAEGLELPIQIGVNLDLKGLKSAEGLKLPIQIGGYLDLSGLKSAEGLELPSQIGDSLFLSGLKSAKGLELPSQIGDSLFLSGLKSAEGLELPSQIDGSLSLSGLTSAEGLKLPSQIGESLYLSSLTSAEGLELPSQIGDELDLSGLKSAEGLELPSQIGGSLDLSGLTSAKGLELPSQIGGNLHLKGLKSAEGMKLPIQIGGYLDLSGLTSAEGLELPSQIGGDLDLRGLTSAEGLKLPIQIGGNLYLKGLTSAEGLKLPSQIDGNLDLSGLTSAEGLELPSQIGGNLDLSGLTSAEGLKLPSQIGGNLVLKGLKSAKGLKLPNQIGGNLDLSGLTSAEGLELPDQIVRSLYLSRLKSAEGLELPSQIGGDLILFCLTSAKGLMLPKSIGRSFYCPLFNDDLEYAKEYLKNQEEINRPKKI